MEKLTGNERLDQELNHFFNKRLKPSDKKFLFTGKIVISIKSNGKRSTPTKLTIRTDNDKYVEEVDLV